MAGAVYRPEVLIVPPVALQVTAVFVVPDTAAVNWSVAPVITEDDAAETLTATGATTVTEAEADLVGSTTLVAVTE